MEKRFVDINEGSTSTISYNGFTYDIRITNYSNVGGYAPVLIIDCKTFERYYSDGYIEINGQTIITKWETKYDYYRDNYECSRNLLVSIN